MFDFLKLATQSRPTATEEAVSPSAKEMNETASAPAPAEIPLPEAPVSADATSETVTAEAASAHPVEEIFSPSAKEMNETAPAPAEIPLPEAPVSADVSSEAVTAEAVETRSPIEAYLLDHGFRVDFSQSNGFGTVCDPVRGLALYIAEHYSLLQEFLGHLRQRLCKDRLVSFSMNRLSEAAKNEIIRFAKEKLTPFGLLSNTLINGTGTVTAQIPRTKKVTSFLAGGWLEIYARTVAEEETARCAHEMGVAYQVCSNLLIVKGSVQHELDIVCRLQNGRLCLIETKSGNFRDYCSLLNVGIDIATIPSHTLLLGANMTAESAEAIRYFYDIYCCNLDPAALRSQIREMLRSSVEN